MTAPTLRRRMSSADSSFPYFEKATLPLHIGSTSILEADISRETMVRHMVSREISASRILVEPMWSGNVAFSKYRKLESAELMRLRNVGAVIQESAFLQSGYTRFASG